MRRLAFAAALLPRRLHGRPRLPPPRRARPHPYKEIDGWSLARPRRRQSRRLVVDLRRPGAGRARSPGRRLEPDPQRRRRGLRPGARARERGARRPLSRARRQRRRTHQSSSRGSLSSGGTTANFSSAPVTTIDYTLEGSGSWDLDIWGAIRRQVESEVAAAQASAADLAAAELSAQATLAADYFQLRIAERADAAPRRPSSPTSARWRSPRTSSTPASRPAPTCSPPRRSSRTPRPRRSAPACSAPSSSTRSRS